MIPSGRRDKRQLPKRAADRLSALERLKQGRSARSLKDKYEVEDVENVYEEVDEDEYSEKVRERTLRDFVVDDGKYLLCNFSLFDHEKSSRSACSFSTSDGSYFDDGREIFDADSDEDELPGTKKSKTSRSKPSGKEKSAKTSDIRDMLKAVSGKKKPQVFTLIDQTSCMSCPISSLFTYQLFYR